jgi:hypothetical protein
MVIVPQTSSFVAWLPAISVSASAVPVGFDVNAAA